ncbi:TIR domain-containing protein [Algimonas porphyrae]|uniref:TIR domain-containing protein n=1 Tax=Algimonas porphyrae TaxID=1128113 RepID=A0ABQ5V5E4_9PROT|nr:TIR domain-containing protein [Algimonas porphyrae]GLQ21487.1 hypothetical protein GCM10007854_24420 [Algimonas porphyrae]
MSAPDDNESEPHAETSVFFSYSRQDQAQALPIIQAIEAAGYSVWWDGMLEGGTSFLETTEAALERAKAVVVLWSRHSVTSHWVRDEATSGRERERMIPLTLDGTMPPLGFRQVQVIDMRGWHKAPEAFDDLSRGLAKLHDRDYSPPDRRGPAPTGANVEAGGLSRRTAMLAGLGLGTVGVLGVGGFYALRSSGPNIRDKGLAILPFENNVGDPAYDYLAQGLSSSIRDALAMNNVLRIVARSSSHAVAKEAIGAQAIAERLNVSHILEGRLERGPEGLQLTTSLVDAKSAFQRWVGSLDYAEDQVIALRDQIVTRVVSTLASEAESGPRTGRGDATNPEAFLEFLKGNERLISAATLASIQDARRNFERAIALDPDFARAHGWVSEIYMTLGAYATETDMAKALLDQAEASARKAVDLAPDDALLHAILGTVLQTGRVDIGGAAEPFARAAELGLNEASGLSRYAIFLMSSGQTKAAIDQAITARALDPLNAAASETLGLAFFADRQYEAAVRAYRTALSFQPDRYSTRARLASALIFNGQVDDGAAECAREKNLMERYPCDAYVATRLSDTAAAAVALDNLIATFGDAGAYQQAQIQADMGALQQAMETLLKAESLKDTGLSLAGFDPALDPLRGREDFKALLVRLGMTD